MMYVLVILQVICLGWQDAPPVFGPSGERILGTCVRSNAIRNSNYSDTIPRFRPSVQIDDSTLCGCRGPFLQVLNNNNIYAILSTGTSTSLPRNIRFTKSMDTGKVWLKPNVNIRYDPDTIILTPSVAVDRREDINVIWAETYVGGIQFSRSTNTGITWSNRVRVDDGNPSGYVRYYPDITSSGDSLFASWIETPSSPQSWTPWVKLSTNRGASWVN